MVLPKKVSGLTLTLGRLYQIQIYITSMANDLISGFYCVYLTATHNFMSKKSRSSPELPQYRVTLVV